MKSAEETKFTRGAWTTDITSHPDDGRPVWAVDAGEYSICLLDAPDDAPNEANARLIAAAPDMFKACLLAERELSFVVEGMGARGGLYEEALMAVRGALARARGKE